MVYVLDGLLQITPEQTERANRLVTPQRRECAERYRFEIDRIQSIAAFLLLQYGVREEYGIEKELLLDYSGGKPVLAGLELPHFNLSHCKLAVACALSDRPVGVDVQDWSPRHLSVSNQVCSPEELSFLEQAPEPEKEFIKLWTRKESYGKFTGQGILYPMQEHSFLNRAPLGTVLETFAFQGYALSYCGEKALDLRKVTIEDLLQGREIE